MHLRQTDRGTRNPRERRAFSRQRSSGGTRARVHANDVRNAFRQTGVRNRRSATMKKRLKRAFIAAAAIAMVGAAFVAGRARASGTPASGALTYSGLLQD